MTLRPCLPVQYVGNGLLTAESESVCELSQRVTPVGMETPDRTHIASREFRCWIAGALQLLWIQTRPMFIAAPSTLCEGIGAVIFRAAQKQMGWSNATRVVASVADLHPMWNLSSVRQFPGHAVRSVVSWFARHKTAIPVRRYRADPQPAIIGFFHVLPKPLRHRVGAAHAMIIHPIRLDSITTITRVVLILTVTI